MKSRSNELLDKSIAAMIAAIEIYNKPDFMYRGETFSILAIIPHVPYTVTWNKGAPYSICEDFIDENTELIPAWRIIQTQKQDNSTSLYQHFLNCCNALGIPGAEEFLDRMITLDYIIANEDRHLNNFGAIRNAETLEWIGMAPIYDSGSSLGYDKITPTMKNAREYSCYNINCVVLIVEEFDFKSTTVILMYNDTFRPCLYIFVIFDKLNSI